MRIIQKKIIMKDTEKYPAKYLHSKVTIKQGPKKNSFGNNMGEGFNVFPGIGQQFLMYTNEKSKEYCEQWIKENCAGEKDRVFDSNFLLLLSKANQGETFQGNEVALYEVIHEGNQHTSCRMVFKFKNNKYYEFFYYDHCWGRGLGEWNSNRNFVSKTKYLCRLVEKKIKEITIEEFS